MVVYDFDTDHLSNLLAARLSDGHFLEMAFLLLIFDYPPLMDVVRLALEKRARRGS